MATRLYVGNLPYNADDRDLQAFFGSITLLSIRFIKDRDTGRPRGFGFVEVETPAEAEKAVAELDGQEMGGRRLVINMARAEEGGRKNGGGGGGGGRRDHGGGAPRNGNGRGPRGNERGRREDPGGDFER